MLDVLGGVASVDQTKKYLDSFNRPYRQLGKTNLSVSLTGFGCYRVDEQHEHHRQALQLAIQSGVNLIDTSTNYTDGAAERLVGDVLTQMVDQNMIQRSQMVVVSKLGYIQGAVWDDYLWIFN